LDEKTLEGGGFFLNHYNREQWKRYVKEELEEQEREAVENHLYACDSCLQVYMEVVEAVEIGIPVIEDSIGFAESMMQTLEISDTTVNEGKRNPPAKFYEKVWFHYGIAAAATIILMFTGVFQQLSGVVTAIEKSDKPNTSITKNIMDRTLSIFDELDKNNKESE
jgi:anti-sigma factor RsiW